MMLSSPSIRRVAIFPLLVSVAQAIPAPPVADEPRAIVERASCTFSGSNGAAQASAAQKSCPTIVLNSVAVPAGQTLSLTNLNDGAHVIFEGNTTFGYKEWEGPLVEISGNSITIQGASGAVLDGQGSRWWDGKGSNSGKVKPKFFAAHKLNSSKVNEVYIKNSPVQVFSINNCQGLTLTNVTVDDRDGDSQGGHNTDAFDVGSSSDITITGAKVWNQDDCLAVNSGSNIIFTGGYCSGGHGLSIGSVGGKSDNTVDTVHIESSQVVDSENGVRIKTVSNATGSVSGVTYKDITLSGITDYGIVIEQDYLNGGPTGNPTGGVPITGLTVDNVHGTVASGATDIYILCASGACSDWTWEQVSVTGGKVSTSCKGVPSGAKC